MKQTKEKEKERKEERKEERKIKQKYGKEIKQSSIMRKFEITIRNKDKKRNE